ncbi:E2/UBC family protein [Rhodopseudomonas sp.]|uniref:E2/UBC family protein n=1 Tax=Rhodopseudomonas sp. TaxID=1078 RepID=UPI0039E2B033
MPLRRQFDLPPEDIKFLDDYGLPWETVIDGSMWVLIHDFPTPPGYNHAKVTAAVRIETGYPNAELHMVYFFPALLRRDGHPIRCTDAQQHLDGKNFQRWSRHRTAANPWRIGQDNLGNHVFLIEDWLEREFEKCPSP